MSENLPQLLWQVGMKASIDSKSPEKDVPDTKFCAQILEFLALLVAVDDGLVFSAKVSLKKDEA